jgi:hypothetical protein
MSLAAALLTAALLTADPSPAPASACTDTAPLGAIGSGPRDLERLAELAGRAPVRPHLFVRPSSDRALVLCDGAAPHPSALEPTGSSGPGAELGPAFSRTIWRSGYPEDWNDGAVWQGRGVTQALGASAEVSWGPLSAAVAPLVAWTENRAFPLRPPPPAAPPPGASPWANPFYSGIDLPLRFGASDFWTFDPGDSYVRVDAWNVGVGVSNENIWWGPGVRNAVLFTNTAPGFPHAFIGTSHPADIWIGWLDVQALWGLPQQSRWLTANGARDRRLLTALAASFEPAFAPGLFLGVARVFEYRGIPSASTWFRPLVQPFLKEQLQTASNPTGDSTDNQLASFMARWVIPAARLEIYGEWGRDDNSANMTDLLMEPGHSAAWVLGLQHLAAVRGRWVRVGLEATTTVEPPLHRDWRPDPIFYTHYYETAGHTNDGQMLGAGIGPSSESQTLTVDVLDPRGGSFGGFVERVLRNERWYDDHLGTFDGHDLELSAGVRQTVALQSLDVTWSLAVSRRWHAYFGPELFNVAASVEVAAWPGRRAAPALPPP